MILCSIVAGECMQPFKMPTTYDDIYSCLNGGYAESLNKSIEIGKEEVNQHKMYLRFVCKEEEEQIIVPKEKPKIET